MTNTVRYTYETQEASTALAAEDVNLTSTVSDDIVTAGKVTLAGVGQDNEGAQGLLNANQSEYEASQIQLEAAQSASRSELGSDSIHEGVAGRVKSQFGG